MPRPKKYNTDVERLEARREQHKNYNKKRSKKSNDNNDNNVNVVVNVVNHNNDNNDNNYKQWKEKYETLLVEHKQLQYENSVNCEYIDELQDKLDTLQAQGY